MANGRALVQSPAFSPINFGLLAVAQDMTAQFPSHWEAGVTWQPLCAQPGSTYDECLVVTGVGEVPEPPEKEATTESERRAAFPFTVVVRKDCSAPTFWNLAETEVPEALTRSESWQVERTFWTGVAGGQTVVFPHLAADADLVEGQDTLQTEATVVTETPVNVVLALGLLEAALADCYQGQGVIHVPVELIPHLVAWDQIKLVGGRYITANGNLVAAGAGYTGSAPDGTTSETTKWMYATGAVFYARSPIRSFSRVEGFDRNNNTLEQLAERTYVVGWDCCHLAVPVDTLATISGL